MSFKLHTIVKFDIKIRTLTGLHIGTAETAIRIGTLDRPIIRDPIGRIYIPGSTIKGALRSFMEKKLLLNDQIKDLILMDDDEVFKKYGRSKEEVLKNLGWKRSGKFTYYHECGETNCKICTIFGRASDRESVTPTRLYVNDAFIDLSDTVTINMVRDRIYEILGKSEEELENIRKKFEGRRIYEQIHDDDYIKIVREFPTEIKGENVIDRVTSRANPRFIERLPASVAFRFEMDFHVYENRDKELLKDVLEYLYELNNIPIGGSKSRGYGKIKVEAITTNGKRIEVTDKNSYSKWVNGIVEEIFKGISS